MRVVEVRASLRGQDGALAHSAGSCVRSSGGSWPRIRMSLPEGPGGAPTWPLTSAPGTCCIRSCRHGWGTGGSCSHTSPIPVPHLRVGIPSQPFLLPPGALTGRLLARVSAGVMFGWGLPGLVVLLGPLLLPRLLALLPVSVGAPWVVRRVPCHAILRSLGPLAASECHGSLGVWSELHTARLPQGSG